ncbi:MAG: class II aldolase/adducin family protein [Bacteroidales bacterium]|nr:class II aldolase/adducin family protein [Bacteroidales bacterium]
MDEGYIKFKCNWIKEKSVKKSDIVELNFWRSKFFNLGLIGMYSNGVGFGNISIKHKDTFIISGSATGGLKELDEQNYSLVTGYDFKNNTLNCSGEVKASSESLSHAAVYEINAKIRAVIHIHNLELWQELLYKIPTTSKSIAYGTPEMAADIKRLFKETNVNNQKILCMAGHEEGILSFGKTLKEAAEVLLQFYNKKTS